MIWSLKTIVLTTEIGAARSELEETKLKLSKLEGLWVVRMRTPPHCSMQDFAI
jgi:hypothetical protein